MFGPTRHTWRVVPSSSHYLISQALGRLSLYLCLGTPNWSARSWFIDKRSARSPTSRSSCSATSPSRRLLSSSIRGCLGDCANVPTILRSLDEHQTATGEVL